MAGKLVDFERSCLLAVHFLSSVCSPANVFQASTTNQSLPNMFKFVRLNCPKIKFTLLYTLDIVVIMLLDNIIVFVQQQKKGCLILW
jgi:hypothetical protein